MKPRLWYLVNFGWCCGDVRGRPFYFGDTPKDAYDAWASRFEPFRVGP